MVCWMEPMMTSQQSRLFLNSHFLLNLAHIAKLFHIKALGHGAVVIGHKKISIGRTNKSDGFDDALPAGSGSTFVSHAHAVAVVHGIDQ